MRKVVLINIGNTIFEHLLAAIIRADGGDSDCGVTLLAAGAVDGIDRGGVLELE